MTRLTRQILPVKCCSDLNYTYKDSVLNRQGAGLRGVEDVDKILLQEHYARWDSVEGRRRY